MIALCSGVSESAHFFTLLIYGSTEKVRKKQQKIDLSEELEKSKNKKMQKNEKNQKKQKK